MAICLQQMQGKLLAVVYSVLFGGGCDHLFTTNRGLIGQVASSPQRPDDGSLAPYHVDGNRPHNATW